MKVRDLGLAAIVVVIWGVNFTVIKLGVAEIPPMLLVALRFLFAAFPAAFFVKRPAVGCKYIVAYGLTVGVGQFSCLFYSMHIGMPAGVASVVLQAQAFFTIVFAGILYHEKIRAAQAAGLVLAGAGLFFVSGNVGSPQGSSIPLGALLLTLMAAFFWGLSNIVVRQASKEAALQGKTLNMFALVVWSGFVPPLPMLAASLVLEKPEQVWHALSSMNAFAIFSVLFLALFATLIGYGIWSTLLSKYPAQKIAPLSLLVPVIGLVAAQVILKESLSATQWAGGAIIVLGLLVSNSSSLLDKMLAKNRKKLLRR